MNITYLLGAGASAEALPIVEKIPARLDSFANQFNIYDFEKVIQNQQKSNIGEKHLFRFDSEVAQRNEFEKINRFYNDIIWLKEESEKHSSIDTLAKKLSLKGEDELLKKLKYILSCFFLYEQTHKFDIRYDSFFASILENLSEIPRNLKIVSWNYDSQLEIAFSNFSSTPIQKTRETLNIFSKGNNENNTSSNGFKVFKINGTTNLFHKEEGGYDILPDFQVAEEKIAASFLEIYGSQKLWREHKPNMSFAWEDFNQNSIYFETLKDSVSETDILIVIGYSFPFFNRKVDKLILNSMSKLKKVYVQDPYYSDDIIEKINGFFPSANKPHPGKMTRKIDFIPKTFKDQFFIPIEF